MNVTATGAVFDMVEDKSGLTEVLKSTVIAAEPANKNNNNKRGRQTKNNKAADKRTKVVVRRPFFSCI
jgi:hypothetical protein